MVCEVQHIGPGAIGQSGIGQDYRVGLLAELTARMFQVRYVLDFHRKRSKNLRKAVRIVGMRRDK